MVQLNDPKQEKTMRKLVQSWQLQRVTYRLSCLLTSFNEIFKSWNIKITISKNYKKKGYLKHEKSEFIYFHNISLIIVNQYRTNIGPGQSIKSSKRPTTDPNSRTHYQYWKVKTTNYYKSIKWYSSDFNIIII